jgi:NAD(P)-dependent dehydrogenase (short-subunit alcohol dehydrogenase family)
VPAPNVHDARSGGTDPRPLSSTVTTGRLEGKVALITGAAGGMGREACVVFASEGARIAAVDLDPTGLDGTDAAVRAAGGEIATFLADVADEVQVRDVVERTVERFGGLHVLYNNAGVLWRDRDVSVLDTDETVWDRVFAINLKGMVWVCKYGIPHLIRSGGGAIVNIGSTSALLGDTIPQDAYTASKGAVISFTRNLAVQFGRDGVRANCIHPGFTDTPMQTVRTGDPAWVEAATSAIPLGRLAKPRDIVNAALFLASEESAYVTGAELVVDGGAVVV